ncbi:MAG TPA: cytochrome c oxidase subunit II [Puia sp.]|nr:cytochrome c oxidase subunit II [Puia sp.]
MIPYLILLQAVEDPQSFQAEHINRLFNQFNIAAAGILLLVLFLVIYVTTKFRRRQGDDSEGAPITGNRRVETLMIGFPTVLLAWFFYKTLAVSAAVMPPVQASRQPDVIITGHQFWWEVSYPRPTGSPGPASSIGSSGAGSTSNSSSSANSSGPANSSGLPGSPSPASSADYVITANEVHLPVGRTLLLELRSADVVHDWWVPQLGNKMDLVPGNKNYLWVTIRRPGDYIGACSEFCGQEHAWMRIRVVAQQPQDFDRWLDSNARDAAPPTDDLARQGEALFLTRTCAGCHRIRGTPAIGAAGPDLTHLGNRSTILTGLLTTSEEDLTKWINHPQEIKQGSYMPDFMFGKDSLRAIAHYLEQLK